MATLLERRATVYSRALARRSSNPLCPWNVRHAIARWASPEAAMIPSGPPGASTMFSAVVLRMAMLDDAKIRGRSPGRRSLSHGVTVSTPFIVM